MPQEGNIEDRIRDAIEKAFADPFHQLIISHVRYNVAAFSDDRFVELEALVKQERFRRGP